MALLKGRIGRLVALGTAFVALSGLPAYTAPAWAHGYEHGWGNYRNQWNCGGAQGWGLYPPGQVNGMSWQAAGYSPWEAWEVWNELPKIGFQCQPPQSPTQGGERSANDH